MALVILLRFTFWFCVKSNHWWNELPRARLSKNSNFASALRSEADIDFLFETAERHFLTAGANVVTLARAVMTRTAPLRIADLRHSALHALNADETDAFRQRVMCFAAVIRARFLSVVTSNQRSKAPETHRCCIREAARSNNLFVRAHRSAGRR